MKKNIMYYKNKYMEKWNKCKTKVNSVSNIEQEARKLFNAIANAEEITGYYFVEFGTPIIEHAFQKWKDYIISVQKSNHELSDVDCKVHEILYEFYVLYYKSQYCTKEDIFTILAGVEPYESNERPCEPDETVGYYLVVYGEKDAYMMWKEDARNYKKSWHKKLVDEIFIELAEYKELISKKEEEK